MVLSRLWFWLLGNIQTTQMSQNIMIACLICCCSLCCQISSNLAKADLWQCPVVYSTKTLTADPLSPVDGAIIGWTCCWTDAQMLRCLIGLKSGEAMATPLTLWCVPQIIPDQCVKCDRGGLLCWMRTLLLGNTTAMKGSTWSARTFRGMSDLICR